MEPKLATFFLCGNEIEEYSSINATHFFFEKLSRCFQKYQGVFYSLMKGCSGVV